MLISMHILNVLMLATTSLHRQPAAAQPAAPLDASEAEVSSPASLPLEILKSAERGEVQKVEKWLDEGGPINARYSTTTLTPTGQASSVALLHAAVANNQVEMVTELLRRRASVDLQTCSDVTCGITPLMSAASKGHGGSSGAAGPSEASEAEVPSEFMCSITAEIMTDPVNTVCRTALALGNGWACSCTVAHRLTLPAANTDRWMAIRTNAAPSNSGSRTTTPRPRRASSWTASSLSRATVSVASSENFTRAAGGRQPHTGFVRSGVRYMTLRATFFMKIVCEKCGPFIEDLSFSDIQVIHPPLSDILSPLRYSSPGSLAGGAGVDGFPPKAKAAW